VNQGQKKAENQSLKTKKPSASWTLILIGALIFFSGALLILIGLNEQIGALAIISLIVGIGQVVGGVGIVNYKNWALKLVAVLIMISILLSFYDFYHLLQAKIYCSKEFNSLESIVIENLCSRISFNIITISISLIITLLIGYYLYKNRKLFIY
jgi:hypothetical protein